MAKSNESSSSQNPLSFLSDPQESARRCDRWVDSALTNNKNVQFLMKSLIDLGCTPPDKFIKCMNCDEPAAGGFGVVAEEIIRNNSKSSRSDTGAMENKNEKCTGTMEKLNEMIERDKSGNSKLTLNPEIYICQQYMQNEQMTHQTMQHELIHAIDMCRTNMDPIRNCIQMACTEIRAENLSGECSFSKELFRMSSFNGHGKECVKRRAILSVRANPNCSARAEDYVNAAMNRCIMDFYPYDRHPNQK